MSQELHQLDDYIDHILAAIERIQRYCADADEVMFLQNEMLQDAVIRNFEVIGEASENVCTTHRNLHTSSRKYNSLITCFHTQCLMWTPLAFLPRVVNAEISTFKLSTCRGSIRNGMRSFAGWCYRQ